MADRVKINTSIRLVDGTQFFVVETYGWVVDKWGKGAEFTVNEPGEQTEENMPEMIQHKLHPLQVFQIQMVP